MSRLRPLLRLGLRLLGPALLLYFLLTVNLREVWRTLLATDPWLFLLSVVLVVPFLVLKAIRWQLILRAWQIILPLREATALYCIGIFLGVVTPGQAGDAVKAWYLRKRGYPLSTGLASVVVDRLFDVGISALLAATGLYFFWDILPGGKAINVLVVAGLLAAVVVGLIFAGNRRLRVFVLQEALPRFMPRLLRDRMGGGGLERLHLTSRQIAIITLVSLTGLAWTYIRIYILFLALDTPFPIGPFIALVAILSIVGAASPGGVGTRDLTMVLVLSAVLNIEPQQATIRALSLSTLLLLLNIENVLIGFLYSLRYPLAEARQDALAEPQ
ncbi:MAG TPA: lysylphosphatidylglycerol synthase transmembrane domain-containing protein [Herpetosiphonaceae bacterium]